MLVRIRFRPGSRIVNRRHKNRHVALAVGSLLTPASVLASVLGLWRIGADLKWTADFAISTGLFSHWQIWFATAALLQLCSRVLHRYGMPPDSGGDAGSV